ncbi:MAG TPA: cell wall-binding repeat-containing protein, partial [Desulfosporosinus sp.]|nr:cell wall-binding repeat-containing protein [Desulfosporosinus sp.]
SINIEEVKPILVDLENMITIKRKGTLVMVLLLLNLLMVLFPTNTNASTITNRFSGQDRYQTSRAISEQFNSGTVQDVIIASGNQFPDALSASVLAKKLKAPILLVDNKVADSSETFNYLTQHLSETGVVHIMGGTGIIGPEFEAKLNQMGFANIDRIGGYDRYDTDVLIAQQLAAAKNTPVVIASGEGFPDALSISSVASSKGWPILLVGKDYLSQKIKDYVTLQQPSQVYIVGGTGVISESVEAQIQALALNTEINRLAGEDRFDTNASIISTFSPNPKLIYLSTGFDFTDALSGSVLAAKTGDPIVLIDPSKDTLPPSVANYLGGLPTDNSNLSLIAFGGTSVVPETILNSVSDLVSGLVEEDSIYSVPDITETFTQNQAYALPSTVIATLYNGSKIDKLVNWDTTLVDTSNIGSSVFQGRIEGYNKAIILTLNVVVKPTLIKTTQYGTSGQGSPLYVTSMEVPNPQKVVLVTFETHGYEDAYKGDGQVLVDIGKATVSYFSNHPEELKTTSLFVVCSANPDGLANGWTNNGPGRCQISLGVDINRDFDYYWVRQSNARNKTLAPFSSPEARALESLVLGIQPTDVIDIHGWQHTTYGSPELCSYFQKSLGIGRSGGLNQVPGYFSAWATLHAKRTALIELTAPGTSPNDVIAALKGICGG